MPGERSITQLGSRQLRMEAGLRRAVWQCLRDLHGRDSPPGSSWHRSDFVEEHWAALRRAGCSRTGGEEDQLVEPRAGCGVQCTALGGGPDGRPQ
ncbi:hypothetical protein NDU88_000633 [Pleurodeles waltl]|uniref:Uncharacterized protein n=1 Tax=Pleurodeles waltl TaxID=8319 RepID=A0AAV7S562_PLEWA|nr:hypothetical protein NDU88_000633 [Pleurodeles waltl]